MWVVSPLSDKIISFHPNNMTGAEIYNEIKRRLILQEKDIHVICSHPLLTEEEQDRLVYLRDELL